MLPINTVGHDLFAKGGVFDGWGYVHLHRNTADLPVIDTYAGPEGQDPAFQEGFGNLTVHEVKTDPRAGKDLAYFSYYAAGLRVAKFGPGGHHRGRALHRRGRERLLGRLPGLHRRVRQRLGPGSGEGQGQGPAAAPSDERP